MADLTNTLVAASRADRSAEERLNEWVASNYSELVKALAAEIATDGKPLEARQMASIFLKNTLSAKSPPLQKERHDRWKSLEAMHRNAVKEALLAGMKSPEMQVPHFAAVAAAEVASVELPFTEWPEFVPAMTDNVTIANREGPNMPSESVQHASLECLGFTCERIAEIEELLPEEVPELPVPTVDKMLTTIVEGVQPTRNDRIRLAALQALKNSLAFVRKNMEVQAERDFIMNNAICLAVSSADHRVRQLAFMCLDQVAEFYYDKLPDYMTRIFQLTTEAIAKDSDDSVKMAAIEFWSTVSYMEQTLLDEESALRDENLPLDRPACKKYVETAMTQLVPLLLETLSRQGDEDLEDDEDEWNLRAAGAVCLESISQTVEGLIVPVVMPFVQQHITNENWRLRDAAIVAFASILDGPSTDVIGEFVSQSIPVLLGALNEQSPLIRDSATHCLSNICKMHMAAIQAEQVLSILQGLLVKLQESPRVASHACSAIYNVAQSIKADAATRVQPGEEEQSNILSAPMYPLIDALLRASDRDDAVEANLRVAAMSAAAELVGAAASDAHPVLKELLPAMVGRIETALKMDVLSSEDSQVKEQLLGLLCGLLSSLFQRLDKSSCLPHADRVMTTLLQVLQVQNATCHEEALMAIGTIAGALDEDFSKYLEAFKPFLIVGLRSFQIKSLCMVSIGVVVDICTAVGGQIQPLCDDIMGALMDCLKDASVHRDVKPVVISCFGDIAMAICGAFEPYFQVATMLLMQAAQQQAPPENEDLVAFINALRVAILEAYSGILIGLADGNALQLFVPNVQNILSFLQYLSTPASNRDEEVLHKAVTVIGDIAQQLGGNSPHAQMIRQQLNQSFVSSLVQEGANHVDPSIRDSANWTLQQLTVLLS